jgi:hypothetical protein
MDSATPSPQAWGDSRTPGGNPASPIVIENPISPFNMFAPPAAGPSQGAFGMDPAAVWLLLGVMGGVGGMSGLAGAARAQPLCVRANYGT